MKESAKIHDIVLDFLLNLKPILKKVGKKHIYQCFESDLINYVDNTIIIEYYNKSIKDWYDNEKLFYGRTCVTSENLSVGLKIVGKPIDAYGSILTKDGLLLNNYDGDFDEDCWSNNGYCDIYSFATISESGVIRFSQVIYSFAENKIKLHEDITHNLSFIPDLNHEFGGKRALYRYDNILSIRTIEEVYDKIDDDFKQPYSSIESLSYPRYEIKL